MNTFEETKPLDVHISKLDTDIDEDKKKAFSIDSILGREDLEDARVEDSPLTHGPFFASTSPFVNGKL